MRTIGDVRPALDHELTLLPDLYRRASFNPHMAEVVRFARDVLGGEAFVVQAGGGLAGVSACVPFGGSGWVGAVAVLPERRGAGLGAALTRAATERLLELGATTVTLYATAMGRPVYERLGFVAEGDCLALEVPAAWRREPPPAAPPGVRAAADGDLEAALALDRAATGEDRSGPLSALWPRSALVAESGGGLGGYFLSSPWRPGGGIVAEDLQTGLALITSARRYTGGELQLSVPGGNRPALRALSAWHELERGRTTRMRLGPPLRWRPAALFSAFNLFWG